MSLKLIEKYFDKLEDKIRGRLSHSPIVYTIIGSICIVIFWRGVWHTADILMAKGGIWFYIFYEPYTVVWSALVLLLIGLFVSFFIGDRIIISGMKKEKRIDEKTEDEVQNEELELKDIISRIDEMDEDVEEIKDDLKK